MYEDGSYFSEGIAPEKLNGKWGCIDYKNNTVIPFEYKDLSTCHNNRICAKRNCKWGWINKNNEILVDFKYQELNNYASRYCKVFPAKLNNKWGFIDKSGEIVEKFDYDIVVICSDGGRYYAARNGKKFALYDTKKVRFITDISYDEIGDYSHNRFRIKDNNKYGYIDILGDIVVEPIYKYADEYFSEDIAIVKSNKKSGAIDTNGNIVIPFEYESLSHSSEGIISAIKNRKDGFINRQNDVVIPFGKFNHSKRTFNNGFVNVWTMKDGDFYINTKGEILEIKL